MYTINLKKIFVLSFSSLILSSALHAAQDKEVLAQQCNELSTTVASLVSSQQNKGCIEKLSNATNLIKSAGALILANSIQDAKENMKDAFFNLQIAEVYSCSRYVQISHSKSEAIRIYNLL